MYILLAREDLLEPDEVQILPEVEVEGLYRSLWQSLRSIPGACRALYGLSNLDSDRRLRRSGPDSEGARTNSHRTVAGGRGAVPAGKPLLRSRSAFRPRLGSFFGNTPEGWLSRAGDPRLAAFPSDASVTVSPVPPRQRSMSRWRNRGVCRDFQHLAITLCRAMHIPARYATGYLGDIRIPPVPGPMDFSAWFEVYLEAGGGDLRCSP